MTHVARRPWPRLRALSAIVAVVLVALAVAGCLVSRRVVADQEHKLLKQRADEASLYLSAALSSIETQFAALAATAAATHEQPAAFERTAEPLTAAPGGLTAVALVSAQPPFRVLAHTQNAFGTGLGASREAAVATAVQKHDPKGALVSTPVMRAAGDTRLLGFAYVSPALPDAAIYGEFKVDASSSASTTSSQPFSELVAAVYVGPRVAADQLVVYSSGAHLPLTGDTARANSQIGDGEPWLLVVKARHPLVGSVATLMPWVLLGAGLLTAGLATGIVEALGRRREYAVGLVAMRTDELKQSLADLAAAQDQLVRQERLAAIGQLASTIGHELRNPLGVISNAVYLLRADLGAEPTEAAQRHLATAEREISAATVIVADLLGFARERQPVPEDVDLTALLDEVLSVLPPPGNVTVLRAYGGPLMARADRDMLRQVLLNLVTNGYQAMPEGGALTVRVTADADAVQIEVADTGAGIDAEHRARLFEPFFTTKPRGVGLGLAVSHRMVLAHGGDIVVDSEPGAGATFRVVLPAHAPALDGVSA
ncbi:MAG TPA: ATP-binding protein [Mycobacteriales bacterium]|nr:ATP-binding protein [Mycobacteriales bacterium]